MTESRHWECSERLDYRAGCVYSRHVRVAAIAAAQRQARTSWWDRLWKRIERAWL